MRFLLVTDLDNTLIGDHAATLNLNTQLQQQRDRFHLIYATGRSLSSFRQLCQDFQDITGERLLTPDYLVAGVGSKIYVDIDDHGEQLDQDWAQHLDLDWQRPAVAEIASRFSGLRLQPESEQNPWKISYCLEAEFFQPSPNPAADLASRTQQVEQLQVQLEAQLAAQQLPATVIISSHQDLDILPQRGNKGKALTYLREKLKIPATATLVCGDSGNDISLFEAQTLGVVVANARPELLNWHAQYGQPQHYLARQPYASGIAEALNHFRLA
jgi:sucrose-6-phosphatase